MKSAAFVIEGAQDVELDIPRDALRYAVHYDPTKDNSGQPLLFFLAPFAMAPDGAYVQGILVPHLVSRGFVVVTVHHHGTLLRVMDDGAFLALEDWYGAVASRFNVRAGGDLGLALSQLAALGLRELPADMPIYRDAGSDYESFGFLSALDYLAVWSDLLARDLPFDRSRVLAYGSSHGAYIAMLLLKLAPGLFSAVIENSGWVQAVDAMVNDAWNESARFVTFQGMRVPFRLRSPWTRDPGHPWYFGPSHRAIRDLRQAHFRKQDGMVLLSYHSRADELVPIELKRQAWSHLGQFLNIRAFEIGPDDVDGKVFKSPAHGMDASLRRLFDRAMGDLGEIPAVSADPFASCLHLQFDCAGRRYAIEYQDGGRFHCRLD